ncbi:uncharacterized protein LOC122818662 [Drosophila biarmipes]|uniref:uncharacterized protein LOC122818662 n=1 Tax=Drosophila biarmipes TaxID=125945 RepID=UPI001CDA8C39|nr:uncharacterized protein LOC122818662 [Drosophila biarmipes]
MRFLCLLILSCLLAVASSSSTSTNATTEASTSTSSTTTTTEASTADKKVKHVVHWSAQIHRPGTVITIHHHRGTGEEEQHRERVNPCEREDPRERRENREGEERREIRRSGLTSLRG